MDMENLIEIEKSKIQDLPNSNSDRIKLVEKQAGKSNVWPHYCVVIIDGKKTNFVSCKR
jgi:hypothetical protein